MGSLVGGKKWQGLRRRGNRCRTYVMRLVFSYSFGHLQFSFLDLYLLERTVGIPYTL